MKPAVEVLYVFVKKYAKGGKIFAGSRECSIICEHANRAGGDGGWQIINKDKKEKGTKDRPLGNPTGNRLSRRIGVEIGSELFSIVKVGSEET